METSQLSRLLQGEHIGVGPQFTDNSLINSVSDSLGSCGNKYPWMISCSGMQFCV